MTPQARFPFSILTLGTALLLWSSPLGAQPVADDSPAREKHNQKPVCTELPEEQRRKHEACLTEAERREADQQRRLKEAELKERPEHTSFLKWVHVDGMWMPTSLGASTYGLIGTHVAVANIGRVHFFGPPGVMLLLENGPEGRRIRPALSWGISFHVTDFRMPGTSNNARLFFNLAKCWTMGNQNMGLDMGGLSVTWKN
jgi:hypothetical protein